MLSIVWNLWDHETYPTGWLGAVHAGRGPKTGVGWCHISKGVNAETARGCVFRSCFFCAFKKSLIKDNNENNKLWITDALTCYKKTGAKRHVSAFHCGHAAGHRGFPINLRLWRYTEVVDVKNTGPKSRKRPLPKTIVQQLSFLSTSCSFEPSKFRSFLIYEIIDLLMKQQLFSGHPIRLGNCHDFYLEVALSMLVIP